MKTRLLPLASIVVGLTLSTPTFADDTAHKLFAGSFDNAEQLKKIIKDGEHQTRAVSTVVPCQAGTQFGTAYMLEIPTALQRESREHTFTETWTYPASNEHDATVASREIVGKFKRQRSNPLFSGSVMTEGVSEAAEFQLEVSLNGEPYLQHTFKALGCSEETLADLKEALAAGDPEQLICEMESDTGSRIKRRVCMTRAEKELERDLLEMEMRNSST